MSKHLVRDLEGLQRQVLVMAGYVEDMIYRSLRALQENDKELANEVIAADDTVDQLDNAVVEECLKLLALHQPVAIDLRRIATVFMIATDLERMGDLATDIAERATAMPRGIPIPDQMSEMTDLATSMVRHSLDSFVNLDGKQARRVIRIKDEVERYNSGIIQELMVRMKTSTDMIEPSLSLFSAVRHLERIADHATNIAEDVLYLVDGEIVRHRRQAIEDD